MENLVEEALEIFRNLDKEKKRLKEICEQIPAIDPYIRLGHKFTAYNEADKLFYRVEDIFMMQRRTLLVKEADKAGVSAIFLPENVIFSNDSFSVSTQEKVDLWNGEYDKTMIPPELIQDGLALSTRLYTDYPDIYDKICAFFREYKIQGVHAKNAGIVDGKIKIFDWFGDYTVTGKGELFHG